jgi:hypothetical protein
MYQHEALNHGISCTLLEKRALINRPQISADFFKDEISSHLHKASPHPALSQRNPVIVVLMSSNRSGRCLLNHQREPVL